MDLASALRTNHSRAEETQMAHPDPYQIAERLRHYLRVTDVADGLDAVGRDGRLARQSERAYQGRLRGRDLYRNRAANHPRPR